MADPANMQWCAKTKTLERTSVDGAALYAAQGVVVDGHKMYVYYGGEPMTHGGYLKMAVPVQQTVFRRQEMLRAELRIDGWVSTRPLPANASRWAACSHRLRCVTAGGHARGVDGLAEREL